MIQMQMLKVYKYSYLEECEIFEHERIVRHGDLLVQADLNLGDDGHGGAGPAEEEDDDGGPHPLLHEEGGVQVLEQLVEHPRTSLGIFLASCTEKVKEFYFWQLAFVVKKLRMGLF